ncbi:hypothetical protein [Mycobacterium riyadhense]|uniref:hypothetical protein n=1 Tax=Mycobacterium riyadhense TaxID=486698 RepID=UPI001EF9F03E|nr:hypothetical protein [Mycobacterium riyadhense]
MCINGNEWARRQADKAGIEFTAMDNGFAAVDDVNRLQAICDSLDPTQIEALLRKWLRVLPNPFTDEDNAAGYGYELSILQAEFSLTQDSRLRRVQRLPPPRGVDRPLLGVRGR